MKKNFLISIYNGEDLEVLAEKHTLKHTNSSYEKQQQQQQQQKNTTFVISWRYNGTE